MNKIPIRKFAFRLIIFSVVMAAAGVLFQWILPKYASPAIPFIVIFFFLLTLFTLYVVLRTEHKSSGKKFIAGYMVSRIVKMLSILTFVLLYLFFNMEGRMNFAGAFLIIYFSYSIFEIVALKKE
jgi:predicted neutral ceramidase superfamily lipid hydrolase